MGMPWRLSQEQEFTLSFTAEYFPRQGLLPAIFFCGNSHVIIFCWKVSLAVDFSNWIPQKRDQTGHVGVTWLERSSCGKGDRD